jgi:sec-independent protein translocase protein TatB
MLPDIGGWEFALVVLVGLIVFKPKDLPVVMRKVGQFVGQAKRLAADFRASFEDMARQSELDELRREVESMRSQASKAVNPVQTVKDSITETTGDINKSLNEGAAKPEADTSAPAEPAPKPKAVASAVKPKPDPKPAAAKPAAKPKSKTAKPSPPIVEGGKRR